MNENKKNFGVFLVFSIYSFTLLILEFLLLIFESGYFGAGEWGLGEEIFHRLATSIVWVVAIVLIKNLAFKKYDFTLFEPTRKLTLKRYIVISVCSLLVIGLTTFISGGFKPYEELVIFLEKFSDNAFLFYLCHLVYTFAQMAVLTLTIVFGQKAGELLFKKQNLPYGGFVLAIVWGIINTLNQGVILALYVILLSVLFGTIYIVANKNVKIAFLFIALAFII